MNNNYNSFRSENETIFLLNILNTMYNNNLIQINNLIQNINNLNNLNNSNNQIRNTLVQLLNVNLGTGHNRRNHSRRFDNNSNNFENVSNENSRNINYLIGEYTIPINRNRINNTYRNGFSTTDPLREFEDLFQPVQIYPTLSQIEVATRRVRYCDIARPINTSCPISMDEFSNNSDYVIIIKFIH